MDEIIERSEETEQLRKEYRRLDRITAKLMLTHESSEMGPNSISPGFTGMLEIEEQSYERIQKATAGKKHPLDAGWLKDGKCGILIIQNQEPPSKEVLDKEKKKEETSARTLEVHIEGGSCRFLIPPGEFSLFRPDRIEGISILSRHQDVKYIVFAFPR